MPSVGAVLGTVAGQRIMKDNYQTFQYKLNQYVLQELDNTRDTILVFWEIKDKYANVEMDKLINISNEEKRDFILITQLQEEAKDYLKRVRIIDNNIPKTGSSTSCPLFLHAISFE